MAWSYRSDRSDEVYASTSGPAAATTEQLPRPPADGEDTDAVLNPEVPKPKEGEEQAPPPDMEAGKPVPTPEEQAKLNSEEVVRLSELEQTRQKNEEMNRIRAAERMRLEQEERDKEREKLVKEEQAQVKKEAAADKKEHAAAQK
jgi:hypothetical protein